MSTPSITLRWPELGTRIRCELLPGISPGLRESLLAALPLVSVQSHAVVAGEQMYFPTRLTLEDPAAAHTEDMSRQPPGRVNFEPFFQYLSINYGPISEAVPAFPVAQVIQEDLPLLRGLGERVWNNLLHGEAPLHVIASRGVEPSLPGEGPFTSVPAEPRRDFTPPPPRVSPRELTAFLLSETDRIWLHEPEDTSRLRTGRSGSEAGVGGQYLSPWVMVTGLVRSLAVVEVAALVRMAASGRLGPAQTGELLSELLLVPSGVTGYFGLPELGAVLGAVRSTCAALADPAETRTFLSVFSTYLNRYNLWLHQGFPWRLGQGFQRPDGPRTAQHGSTE